MRRGASPAVLVAATRPGFLTLTALALLLGLAHAWHAGAAPPWPAAGLTLLGALLVHAGANVINDVYDALNGSDAANGTRVPPFTGGSRFIQEGALSIDAMRRLAYSLFATALPVGLALLALGDPRLVAFGVAGMLLAFTYSAPPLQLMSRGLGELAVVAAWLLIVAGTDFVQRQTLDAAAWLAGLPFVLQLALVLIVNQVPDHAADAAAGKRNWIVRLGPPRAAPLYGAVTLLAFAALPVAWLAGALPAVALAILPLAALSATAMRWIARHASHPARLGGAIHLTLLNAHLVGLALVLSLLTDRSLKESP